MTTSRSAVGRALAAESRVELLHRLQTDGPRLVDDLVAGTGLHANTVREHLAVLVDVGLVRRTPEVRTVRGRPRMIYRVTTAEDLASDPDARSRLEADIAQARRAAALLADAARDDGTTGRVPVPEGSERDVLALEAHLDRVGFDPVYAPGELTFHLFRCPFVELARARQDVVCRLHTELAQSVLEQADGAHEVERLEPFVGEEHCTLSLRRRIA
ncbi:metalloregulator ArsR/SmtB family transcription factor [Sanguibacter sp. HDW7]|uniref:helix-turn-helix transcriptional regulator n=1 Tax=Sanguibacter sp. HDW7 TaxID=2714931 RepID=UPI0014081406|nr:helix-turn-helix domain-containing protein [Sanguibacter sp. HDW7]QIK84711.1 helix-turn-helix domain-containing protein [Sanguibacter sp. HDW7]